MLSYIVVVLGQHGLCMMLETFHLSTLTSRHCSLLLHITPTGLTPSEQFQFESKT